MRRIVNLRCFPLLALMCAGGAAAACMLPTVAASITAAAVSFALLAVAAKAAFRRAPVAAVSFALALAGFLACFLQSYYTVLNWKSEISPDEEHYIICKVESITAGTERNFVAGDVRSDGAAVRGKIAFSVKDDGDPLTSFLRPGDVIMFRAKNVKFNELVDGIVPNGYLYRYDIRYSCNLDEWPPTLLGSEPTFFQWLRGNISDVMEEEMGPYAGVAYCMLTGDKGLISGTMRNAYSASGLGHILAVSGLHVGFVTATLAFILRKLRVRKLPSFIVTTCFLLFYCFLAGFSASCVRAAVMCTVGLIAGLMGKRNDPLNTLGLAASLILIVRPISAFDVGFLMSITAVAGLIFFYRPIKNGLSRFLPGVVANAIAAPVSATLGISPLTFIYFTMFPVYTIITNIVVIPLVGLTFVLCMFALVIVLIFPATGIILGILGIPFSLVDTLAGLVARLPFSSLTVFGSALTLLIYPLYFLMSRFVMLPYKPVFTVAAALGAVAIVIVTNVPLPARYDVLACTGYVDVTTVVRTEAGVAAVGDFGTGGASATDKCMRAAHERRVDAVYTTDLSRTAAAEIVELSEMYEIGIVRYPSGAGLGGMYDLIAAGLDLELIDETHVSPFGIELIVTPSSGFYYLYRGSRAAVLMAGFGDHMTDVPAEVLNEAAMIRSGYYYGDYPERAYIVNFAGETDGGTPAAELVVSTPYAIDTYSGEVKGKFV